MSQILINALTIQEINSALLRVQRSIKNNQASLTTNVTKIVSSGSSTIGGKYDDAAILAQINALSASLSQALLSVDKLDERVTNDEENIQTNANNIASLQSLLSNINFTYDEATNTIHFTDINGDTTDIPLIDTTYDFAFDSGTHKLSVENNLTGETVFDSVVDTTYNFSFDTTTHKLKIHNNMSNTDVFDGVVDTVYSFTWNNGTLTITDNRSANPVATINFDNRYYTEDEIQALVLDLIPSQASSENQLADKAFVNSSIETSTATFRGTFDSVTELNEYSGPVDNNDYAFVKTLDVQSGLYQYDRYKWVAGNPGGWVYEYTINSSGFTAEQLAALNSGITASLVAKITDVYNCSIQVNQNGTCKGSFTLNQSSNATISLTDQLVKQTQLSSSSAEADRNLLIQGSGLANNACSCIYVSCACPLTYNHKTGIIKSMNTDNWGSAYSGNTYNTGYYLLAQLVGSAATGNHDVTLYGTTFKNSANIDYPTTFRVYIRGRCDTVNATSFKVDNECNDIFATYEVDTTNHKFTLRLYGCISCYYTKYNTQISYTASGDVSTRISTGSNCLTFPGTYFATLPNTETLITKTPLTVMNSTCFGGCTYECAKADIRSGLISDMCFDVYCGNTCKCTITNGGCLKLCANAFNANAQISTTTYPGACCKGTLTGVSLNGSSFTVSNGVATLTNFKPATAGTADNSTCFGGCTYAQACSDIRNGLVTTTDLNSCGYTTCIGTLTGVSLNGSSFTLGTDGVASLTDFKPATAGTADNSTCFNGCTYAQACTNIRSGLCSHDCLVKLSLLCSNTDRRILFSAQGDGAVCPVYASNGVSFTYNACCGCLKIGDFTCNCCDQVYIRHNVGLIRSGPKGGQTNGFVVYKENNCLDNCSIGVGIGSGNINRGFFDYCKASETATSPTFRWLQYWDDTKEIHNLPIWGELGANNKVVYSCTLTTPSNTRRYALVCFDKTCCGNPSNVSACFEVDIYTSKYYIWIDVANSAACMRTYWVNNGLNPNSSIYGSFCTALPDTTANGNCFWITYSNYRAPVIKSARKITILCNTTTAPSGITFTAPTNRNSYIDVYCGTTCVCTLQGPSSLCLGSLAFSSATIPTVNNPTIKIQKNSTDVGSFTLNQATDATIDISVPTKTSDITNDCNFTTMEAVEACGYLKNCLATNIKVCGSDKTTVLDTIGTLDNTYPKKTYQVNCSTAHCRYIYLGKLPVSSGAVSYASLTMYLFSYNCQITQSYPIGTIQIDVSSGASCTAFNIRGWSDIPLNSATCAASSPRIYVTKDATCGYYCLYLDDSYTYLKPKVQINQNTNFTVGDLSASSAMSGDSYWNSVSCNDIVYLNKINKWCVDVNGNTCCMGFICGNSGSLMNFLFYKAGNTVSTSTGDPVYRLIYDVTAWWNCAGSSSSNTSARGIVGSICAYRNSGYGTSSIVDIEAWTNYGRGSVTNPLQGSVLKLVYFNKGTDIVQPLILKNITSDGDKYYLALKQCSYASVPLMFSGLSYSGAWLTCQICATNSSGALPACWEVAISGVKCSGCAYELYTTTPFIDFHVGNLTCDYTHRIIANPGTSTTTYGNLQFLTNCVSYNPNNSVYTCTQGCNFYMYPNGMFQTLKGAYFGSDSADTCRLVTIDCDSQYSIRINKESGVDKGILLTTAKNCLDYCSLGIEIGSGNVNRGFFDYYKASETATTPTFRWLLYANADTWTSTLQKFQIGSGSATESAGIIYGKGTCSTCPVIRFLNNTSATDGNGYLMYAGGIGILGAGEGAGYVWCNINGSTDLYGACVGKECLYLTSDNNIYFYTNTQCNDSSCWKISCIDSNGIYYGTAVTANSYVRTPLLIDTGVAGTASTSKCVIIRACCTDCNCTVTTRDWTFCGRDGLLYSNGFRTNCNGVSISYPKASTTYVLLGCIRQTQLDNEYQIGFYVSGSNVVNNGVLKWIGSNSGTQGQNNIEIKLSNYCNNAYGITGIGFIKTASTWNCWTCVVLRICNQHATCAYCWNTGVYKNQIGTCGGWVENFTCLGSTAPTFDCFIEIPTECRNFTYRNGRVCVEGDFDAPLIHTKCIYSAYPAKNTSQTLTFYARCCNASAIQTATMTFNPTGVLCVCRINNNGYNQKWQQTLNLSTGCVDCFYPVTWPSGVTYETDIEIQSPSGSGSMAYNQNYIHFYERAAGWTDMPKTIYVQTLSRFDNGENVFGCIGYGTGSSNYSVIWLRGGMNYTVNANVALTAHTENVTCGTTNCSPSTYTVGTSLCGGTNTCVGVFANATTNTGSFMNNNARITGNLCAGAVYNTDGCPYILKCEVDGCGYLSDIAINVYCGTSCKCTINNNGTLTLGTNAFNSTAFCSHDCLVKLADVSSDADRAILQTGNAFTAGCIACVYKSTGKCFTFNAGSGVLKVGCRACNSCGCIEVMGGTTGGWFCVYNCDSTSYSMTSGSTYYIKIGTITNTWQVNSTDITIAVCGNSTVDKVRIHWVPSMACAAGTRDSITIDQANYNSPSGIKCVGWKRTGTAWNNGNDIYLVFQAPATCNYIFSLYRNQLGGWSTGFSCTTTAPGLTCSVCTKPNGTEAFHWKNGRLTVGTLTAGTVCDSNGKLASESWVTNKNYATYMNVEDDEDLNIALIECPSLKTVGPSICCSLTYHPRTGTLCAPIVCANTFNGDFNTYSLIQGGTVNFSTSESVIFKMGTSQHSNGENEYVIDVYANSLHSYIYLSVLGDIVSNNESGYTLRTAGCCNNITFFGSRMTCGMMCIGMTGTCGCTYQYNIYCKNNHSGMSSGPSTWTITTSNYQAIDIISYLSPDHEATSAYSDVSAEVIYARCVITTSKKDAKKDIKLYDDCALDLLRKTNIYEYKYKTDSESDVKHVGILADYTDELISGKNKDSFRHADTIGILLKAVKELDERQHPLRRFMKWLNHLLRK